MEAALPACTPAVPPLHAHHPPSVPAVSFDTFLSTAFNHASPINPTTEPFQTLPAPPRPPPPPPAVGAATTSSSRTDCGHPKQQQHSDVGDLFASLSARLSQQSLTAPAQAVTASGTSTARRQPLLPSQDDGADLESILAAASAAVPQAKPV